MDILRGLNEIAEEINENREMYCNSTEEQTKQSLVVPFIEALGYNTRKFCEVQWENAAANGRVDCKIICGASAILIECKKLGTKIGDTTVKQLASYFNSCQDDNKVGIITDGEKYILFTDMIKEGYMDSKPFLSFSITDIKDSDIRELEQLSKEKFNEYRVGLEKNYAAFEEVCTDILNQFKDGSVSNEVMYLIIEQSDLKNYRNMFDMGTLKKIMQKQINRFVEQVADKECNHTVTKNKCSSDLDEELYAKVAQMGLEVNEEGDEYFSEECDGLDTLSGSTAGCNNSNVVSLIDAAKGNNAYSKFISVIIGENEIKLKRNKWILIEIIKYAISKDIKNVEKLVTAYENKTVFAIRYGKDMGKYKDVISPYYLKDYDISVMIAVNSDTLLKYAVDILRLCSIDTSDVSIRIITGVK